MDVLTSGMFYTDTNGRIPKKRDLALVLLEIAMDTVPLCDLDIEKFCSLVRDWDGILPEHMPGIEE